MAAPDDAHASIPLSFHGRIIDHLGIQMYQSPVAALAEMVANAWDADATEVDISVPGSAKGDATVQITARDDGVGMSFSDCKDRFLNVGYNRRGDNPDAHSPGGRPLLGRKGIGKFAGFGVAQKMRVDTTYKETGERTVFELDARELRGDGETYVVQEPINLAVKEYRAPQAGYQGEHGTTIVLSDLLLERGLSQEAFARSMARRFLLHQRGADFAIKVNGNPIPESESLEGVQYVFPRDYDGARRPDDLDTVADGDGESALTWGRETLSNGATIQWRFVFYRDPIQEEELRGVSVFARGKLAQGPFLFQLVGGLGAQQAVEYLSGTVVADYLDLQPRDIITTERQRINWQNPQAEPLLTWGKRRVQKLLREWQRLRGLEKVRVLEEKVSEFGPRLEKLPKHERAVVKQAIHKLADMPRMTREQFIDAGSSILFAWEKGRLRDLIADLAGMREATEQELLEILFESQVLTAVQTLEAVRAKVDVIEGLRERIQERQLENKVRDYIADNPWLISPEWERFKREVGVKKWLQEAAAGASFDDLEDFRGRVDLVLRSSSTLLVIEFMRPGVNLDAEHLARFGTYMNIIESHFEANTAAGVDAVIGYVIADGLARKRHVVKQLEMMEQARRYAMDWNTFLDRAHRQWSYFYDVLRMRAPEDDRIKALDRDRVAKGPADAATSVEA